MVPPFSCHLAIKNVMFVNEKLVRCAIVPRIRNTDYQNLSGFSVENLLDVRQFQEITTLTIKTNGFSMKKLARCATVPRTRNTGYQKTYCFCRKLSVCRKRSSCRKLSYHTRLENSRTIARKLHRRPYDMIPYSLSSQSFP